MNKFFELGTGRPSDGGPRMDRWAVTSPGVVKISRRASCLRRSAPRGPDPTVVLLAFDEIYASKNGYSHPAKTLGKRVWSKTVTHSLPRECGPKLSPTACQESAVTVTNAGRRMTF